MRLEVSLLIIAIVIIACLLCNKLSSKFGIPMLLAFIVLGMIFGSDGIFKIPFDNFEFAEEFSSIALIFIIFYGGFGTNWKAAKQVAIPSLLLSSAGVILTALGVGAFCHYVMSFSWYEGMLIGAVLSSTDAASVFSLLRNKQLNLKYGSASMLELESGSNDPWAFMMTVILLSMASADLTIAHLFTTIFSQVVFGMLFGVLISYGSIWFMKHIQFEKEGFDTILIVAIALISYAAPAVLGGNGYLSAYIVGIVLGNMKLTNQKTLVHFFDGAVGLIQILIFFLLGLLAFPSQMGEIIVPAIGIFLFLTFVARPLVVMVLLAPFHAHMQQRLMVSWAGLRGATSIVFAIMVQVSDAYVRYDVFHIAFCIVLLSIGIQGTLLPYIAKKLDMIDDQENVLKTFSDYDDVSDIAFLRIIIDEHHVWNHSCIEALSLPEQLRIALILRDDHKLLPSGSFQLHTNDQLILSTTAIMEESEVALQEIPLSKDHAWINHTIQTLDLSNSSIVLINRDGTILLPKGDLILLQDDVVVVLHESEVSQDVS